MIDSILSVEDFNLEQIKGKNIVIPIAYNREPPNDYFVTLFYDAENKQLTIYDPLDNYNLYEVDSYSNILKTKLNLDINKTVKTKLNLLKNPSNSRH